MEEKQFESDDHEEIQVFIEISEYIDNVFVKKKQRRGRKRKRYSSEDMEDVSKRSSLSMWSDIDDDDEVMWSFIKFFYLHLFQKKNRLSTKEDISEEGVHDESISDTVDPMKLTEESMSMPDPEGEDVNILDTSSDDGEIHNDSN